MLKTNKNMKKIGVALSLAVMGATFATTMTSHAETVGQATFNAKMISAGAKHTLALKEDGTVWAWGNNNEYQLGDHYGQSYTPVQVNGISNVVKVEAKYNSSFALKSDGTVWGWGYNGMYQLGDGTYTNSKTPVQVPGLNNVVDVSSGQYSTTVLKSDGTVWSWGQNMFGNLGDGTTTLQKAPVQAKNLSGITAISVGTSNALALKSDGTVWTWGSSSSSTPSQVSGISGVKAIAEGSGTHYALKNDGTVWAWGSTNSSGQFGDGTTTNKSGFYQAVNLTNVVSINANSGFAVAVKSDGTVWTWGSNSSWQLGNGTSKDSSVPIQVAGANNVLAVATGDIHSIALKNDGSLMAWGGNGYGQAGNGTFNTYVTPFQITNFALTTPKLTLTASTTNMTNQDVQVSIDYPTGASKVEYRIDGGAWKTYMDVNLDPIGAVTFSKNGLLEARALDSGGSVIATDSLTISNIDKVAPNVPLFWPNTSSPAKSVVVDIEFPSDAAQKLYRVGNSGEYVAYESPITVTQNGWIYARAIDEAGNMSQYQTNISNIDTTPPVAPTITTQNTIGQHGSKIVTVSYPSDAAVKEYRLASTDSWTAYTGSVTVTNSVNFEARVADAAGNESISSLQVDVSNHAPTLANAVPTQTITEGGSSITIDISNVFADVDGDTLTYTANAINPDLATVSLNGTKLTITPVKAGAARVNLRVSDGIYMYQHNFNVNVENVADNTPPVIDLSNWTLNGDNSVATVIPTITDDSGAITVKKWAKGDQSISYFDNAGTVFADSFDVSKNAKDVYTVFAMDAAGNKSIATIVLNWDTTPPVISLDNWTVSQDKTKATVTPVITDESAIMNKIWIEGSHPLSDFKGFGFGMGHSFTNSFDVPKGTYTVYAVDTKGNQSVQVLTLDWDTTPPADTTFTADKTTPTNGIVTVTINYPSDASLKQYKVGSGGTWTNYTMPVVVTSNNTVFARSQDLAGNMSSETSYTVTNIDKTAPTTPTLTADKTAPTNENVVVTITYSADASVKEYRVNGGTWMVYASAVTMTANGTVEARATDAAGNVSGIGSLNVTNIKDDQPSDEVANAVKLVEKAEASKTQTDVNAARSAVNSLEDGDTKTELQNRLDVIDKALITATSKVVLAEKYKTQTYVTLAQTSLNSCFDSPAKALLQARLDQVSHDLVYDKATAKVQQAETYKRDPYITDAWTLVNALPAGSDKDDLIERLNVVSSGSSGSSVQVAKATAKVGQAETYKRDPYLTDAWTLVNALPEGADKDGLTARLNAISSGSASEQVSKATSKVVQAETYKRDPYLTDAWTLVNALPEGADKDALTTRLNAISSGSASEQVSKATSKVEQAETYKRDPYLADAWTLVNALPEGADKDALTARLNAIASSSTSEQVSKATSKVEQAETYKRDPYLTDAWTLVNALPEGADKDALTARLNAIASGSTSEQVSKATAKVEQAEKYKRDPYLTDAWTLVNALPEGADKVALTTRLNALATPTNVDTALKSATDAVVLYEKYKTSYYKNKALTLVTALPDGENKIALQNRLDTVQ